MAHVLWAFDVVPVEALDVGVQTGFTPAVVMIPKPFKVRFVMRRSREVLVEEERKAGVMIWEMLGENI